MEKSFYVMVSTEIVAGGALIVNGTKPWVSNGSLTIASEEGTTIFPPDKWFAVFSYDPDKSEIIGVQEAIAATTGFAPKGRALLTD